MAKDPNLDDDTSIGRVTQGGRGRRGHSIWWVLAVAVVAIGVLAFAVWLHRTAPAEQGTTPVAGPVPTVSSTGATKP